MESGWIINFKNGQKNIMSETVYENYKKYRNIDEIQSEAHWFSLDVAITENPNIEILLN